MSERRFKVETRGDTFVFNTGAFTTEKGSMLHAGIHNREMKASLAAGAVLVIGVFVMRNTLGPMGLGHFFIAGAVFIGCFLLFRTLAFKDPGRTLEISGQDVTVTTVGFTKRVMRLTRNQVSSLALGRVVHDPRNLDGIAVVEKIALQHNTAIPGFGDVKTYHTVELCCTDGATIVLYADEDEVSAQDAFKTIDNYIGGDSAKA